MMMSAVAGEQLRSSCARDVCHHLREKLKLYLPLLCEDASRTQVFELAGGAPGRACSNYFLPSVPCPNNDTCRINRMLDTPTHSGGVHSNAERRIKTYAYGLNFSTSSSVHGSISGEQKHSSSYICTALAFDSRTYLRPLRACSRAF